MSDTTLSDALAEAYASAPSSRTLIHTLSITYDGMMVGDVPGEVYIFQGYSGDSDSADNIPTKSFRLEPAASYRGGQAVDFIGIPFDVIPPAVTNSSVSKGKLVLDGVDREVTDLVRGATMLGVPIQVTYRAYLSGLELDGPQNDPPMVFSLQAVKATAFQVTGEITVTNLSLKKFPRELYKRTRFPAIRI